MFLMGANGYTGFPTGHLCQFHTMEREDPVRIGFSLILCRAYKENSLEEFMGKLWLGHRGHSDRRRRLGQKQWSFDTTADAGFGLQNSYLENSRPSTSGSFSTVAQTAYTWTSDSLSRPYIGTVTTTLDGTAQKKTTQVLDQYGNATSKSLHDSAPPVRRGRTPILTWAIPRVDIRPIHLQRAAHP
jgi:hypothetical protein